MKILNSLKLNNTHNFEFNLITFLENLYGISNFYL